jgi:RimJ/RimL family protein N-acetyltransferase
VMKHFPSLLTNDESRRMICDRFEAHFEAEGFGLWALERKWDCRFIGFTGLQRVAFPCPIGGEVEIGWRLAREFWGQGFAREAAKAALGFAWGRLRLPRVFAMTISANRPSWGLMERLGMTRRPELDFDHPRIPEGHPTRPQVVYAIDCPR